MKKIVLIMSMLWLTIAVVAQTTTCSSVVLDAINQVENLCQDVARNQICYGNPNITASPAAEIASLNFNSPGSIEELSHIASFDLAALDIATGVWGISLLKVQANLPDTTPGVNVTVLTFGNVGITPESPTGTMQAFSLSTGIGQISCSELPDSGIVIQTPDGVGTVNFTINGVQLALGSTLYLQADEQMWIAVLEGEAVVSNNGVSETVPAGEFTTLQLDALGQATSAPTLSQPYTADDVRGLPIQLLPEEIEIAPGVGTVPEFTGVTCPYVVRSGENLFRIALNSGATVSEIATLNNITDPTRIYAGQRLLLPSCVSGPITVPVVVVVEPTATPIAGVVNNCFPEIVNYCDAGRPWGDGRCISDDQGETDYNYQQGWYAAALECGAIDSIPDPPMTGTYCTVVANGGRIIDFTLNWGMAMPEQSRVEFNFDVDTQQGMNSYSEEVSVVDNQISLDYRFVAPYVSYDSGVAYILDGNGMNLTGPIPCDT